MPYPWPSFDDVMWETWEEPVEDSGWNGDMSLAQGRALGSAQDDLQVMAPGSETRTWEQLLSPEHFSTLKAKIALTAVLTDWETPVPNSRRAFLRNVEKIGRIEIGQCADGVTRRRYRARVTWISQ